MERLPTSADRPRPFRLAVVSDTHVPHHARRLPELLARVTAEAPDAIVHCGDFTSLEVVEPFAAIAPFEAVAGNNDGPEIVARFGRSKIVVYAGRRFGIVHGDGGARTSTLERALATFAREQVDAVLFGHSHHPVCALRDGRLALNPGSGTDRRTEPAFSYAVVDIDAAGLVPRIVRYRS
jgi:putative phosphoesterase